MQSRLSDYTVVGIYFFKFNHFAFGGITGFPLLVAKCVVVCSDFTFIVEHLCYGFGSFFYR